MKNYLPLFLALLGSLHLSAQAFLQRYVHTSTDSIFVADIASAPDGGVYALATVARTSLTGSTNASDGIVLRTDANGTLLWEREYDTGNFQNLNEIRATPDGGFILGGTATTDYFDGYLAKADPAGNIQWTRYLGDDELQRGYELLTTADGGYMLAGHHLNNFTTNLYVVKLDAGGNEVWSRRYFLPVDVDQTGFTLTELPSGNVVVAGATGDLGGNDAILAEINTLGAVMWARQIDYSGFRNIGISLARLPGGDLVLLQRTTFSADPFGTGRVGIVVSRLTVTGEEVWTQVAEIDDSFTNIQFNGLNFAFTSEPGKVLIDPDGNIVISCQADFEQVGAIRPQLLKLDPDGNFIWGRSFGAPEFLHIPSGAFISDGFTITSDNHYAVIYQGVQDRQSVTVGKLDIAGQELCVDTAEPEWMSAALTVIPFNYSTVAFTGISTRQTTVVDRNFTSEPAAPEIPVDLGPDTLICVGESLTLDPDLGDGFNYLWQDGSTLDTFVVNTSGEYSVTVVQGNCIGSDTIQVQEFSAALDLGPDQTICVGENVVLEPAELFPGDYTWNDGTDGPTLQVLQPGTYILTLSNPVCGTLMDTVVINPVSDINLSIAGPSSACEGQDVSFLVGSSTPGLSYSWLNGAGEVIGDMEELSLTATDSDTYTVFATDGCGVAIDSIVFSVMNPAASVQLITTTCGLTNGQLSIENLTGTPPFDLEWTDENGTLVALDAQELSDLAPGDYNLLLTDAAACTFNDSYTIDDSEGISVTVATQDLSCVNPTDGGFTITPLTGTAPFSYSLEGGTPQAEGFFTNLSAGDYELLITDAAACDTSLMLTINADPDPTATILAEATDLALGDSTALQVQTNLDVADVVSIKWEPALGLSCDDCLNPVAQPTQTTTYTVLITDTNGCVAVAEITLTIDPKIAVFIPNVFSPNNDGTNDRFLVFPAAGIASVASVQVFDRWGGMVYDSKDNLGWDGRIAGDEAAPGVYVYQVELLLFDGTTILESGDITLIR
ncbi:MAG: gliding motility-associated C-terminal domain-containing protein [Bacteroidota bacterium]